MRIFTFLLTMAVAVSLQAQDTTELVRRNGFKTIRLGTSIDSIKGATFKKEAKEKNEFAVRLYQVDNIEYKNIGEVRVKDIQVKTYNDLIYQINVFTEKDDRVIRALEKSFGQAVYLKREMCWKWGASPLSLSFYSHKNNLELIYRSHPVIQKMYEDKGKKLDAIAEGF